MLTLLLHPYFIQNLAILAGSNTNKAYFFDHPEYINVKT